MHIQVASRRASKLKSLKTSCSIQTFLMTNNPNIFPIRPTGLCFFLKRSLRLEDLSSCALDGVETGAGASDAAIYTKVVFWVCFFLQILIHTVTFTLSYQIISHQIRVSVNYLLEYLLMTYLAKKQQTNQNELRLKDGQKNGRTDR